MPADKDKIKVCAIVAMAENRVIGKDNALIWHIPEDLKHFKRTTTGHPVIMGRKSWDSLGKPLPNRTNIIISRALKEPPPGSALCASLEEALRAAREIAQDTDKDKIFIIGGGEIFRESMPLCDRIYLTLIHRNYKGDTYFPEFDWNDWTVAEEDPRDGDPALTFYTLDRKL